MIRNVNITILFLFCIIISSCTNDTKYIGLIKTNDRDIFIQSFKTIIHSENKDAFYKMLSSKIDVCRPGVLLTNAPPIKKKEFVKLFNEAPSLTNIAFYNGMLFDSKFTEKEFGCSSYKDFDFNIVINKELIFNKKDGDFNIIIYNKKRDLTTLKFVIKNKKIIKICNDFISAYGEDDYPTEATNFYSYSNPTLMYSDNGIVLAVIPRNVLLNRILSNKFEINQCIGTIPLKDVGVVLKGFSDNPY